MQLFAPSRPSEPASRWVLALALGASLAAPACAQAPLRVLYPAAESAQDARQGYPKAVLQMALEHAGLAYSMRASSVPANQRRALRMLAAGDAVDVVWTVTTDAREREFRSIPYAIDRGMYGWRVLLVRRGDEARFSGITDASGLAPLLGAQGHDWPDLQVLRAANLRVQANTRYDSLFEMLARGRIDYLPRSVLEVGDELARHPAENVSLEPRLLLRYPSALRFFVKRDNEALAAALTTGLAKAEADGCLDQLFHATFDGVLAPLGLTSRATITLANPVWSSTAGTTP